MGRDAWLCPILTSILSLSSDAVVAQVLDELGLSLTDELSNLPSTGGSLSVAAGGKKAEATASALVDADADLEERLKNLRRD